MVLAPNPYVLDEKKVAIFVPKYNTTKPDATGAFHPEAKAFCKFWHVPQSRINYLDNKKGRYDLAEDFLDAMQSYAKQGETIEDWILFCHGYTHGVQFGIRSPGHKNFNARDREQFERFISYMNPRNVNLILFACSTGDDPDGDSDTAPGSGDGSFGDLVRDAIVANGGSHVRVLSHTTAGHTTGNPFIKLFEDDQLEGGQLIAQPFTPEFKKLQSKLKTSFRFLLPFLSVEEIRKQLE